MGAIFGGGIGILFHDTNAFWLLPLMIFAGAIGGALWGLIPAILKTKYLVLFFSIVVFIFGVRCFFLVSRALM